MFNVCLKALWPDRGPQVRKLEFINILPRLTVIKVVIIAPLNK